MNCIKSGETFSCDFLFSTLEMKSIGIWFPNSIHHTKSSDESIQFSEDALKIKHVTHILLNGLFSLVLLLLIVVFSQSIFFPRFDSAEWFNSSELADRIPLEIIYSTNGQAGLRTVPPGKNHRNSKLLNQIYVRSYGMGASNVFLVGGDNISAAIESTLSVFVGGKAADHASNPIVGKRHEQLWLVVYFGPYPSEPPIWEIDSVERERKHIRVNCHKTDAKWKTNDVHQYFAWVPVGAVEDTVYTLDLFETRKNRLLLQRRVKVNRGQFGEN